MKPLVRICFTLLSILFCFFSMSVWASTETFHHQMHIVLSPDTSEIRVEDHITVPKNLQNQKAPVKLNFILHQDLVIKDVQGAQIESQKANATERSHPSLFKRYTVTLSPQAKDFTLQFQGKNPSSGATTRRGICAQL